MRIGKGLSLLLIFTTKQAIMDYRKGEWRKEWIPLESPATIERIQQACQVELKD